MIQLKEVIHLYLGCDLWWKGGNSTKLNEDFIYRWRGSEEIGVRIKPILRPLSDMTEEEMTDLAKFAYPTYTVKKILDRSNYDYTTFTFENQHGITCHVEWYTYKSQAFIYLLKQCFDLFGLIESKQAIDKTK